MKHRAYLTGEVREALKVIRNKARDTAQLLLTLGGVPGLREQALDLAYKAESLWIAVHNHQQQGKPEQFPAMPRPAPDSPEANEYHSSLMALKNAAEACSRAGEWNDKLGWYSIATDCRLAGLAAKDAARRMEDHYDSLPPTRTTNRIDPVQ